MWILVLKNRCGSWSNSSILSSYLSFCLFINIYILYPVLPSWGWDPWIPPALRPSTCLPRDSGHYHWPLMTSETRDQASHYTGGLLWARSKLGKMRLEYFRWWWYPVLPVVTRSSSVMEAKIFITFPKEFSSSYWGRKSKLLKWLIEMCVWVLVIYLVPRRAQYVSPVQWA